MTDKEVILHVSDWNCQDKYYQMPLVLLIRFRDICVVQGIERAWDWLTVNTDYHHQKGEESTEYSMPIRYGYVNMLLDKFSLDYSNPLDGFAEWDEILKKELNGTTNEG